MRSRRAHSNVAGQLKAREWRNTFARLSGKTVDGVNVLVAPNLKAYEACQYVACTDSLRLVVQTGSGAIAGFQWGEFRGWYTAVAEAVADMKVARLPHSAFR